MNTVTTILAELGKILVISTPVTIGLVEVAKMAKLPTWLAPVVALILGFGVVSLLMGSVTKLTVLYGIITGLAASGLYSGVASTGTGVVSLFKKKPSANPAQ